MSQRSPRPLIKLGTERLCVSLNKWLTYAFKNDEIIKVIFLLTECLIKYIAMYIVHFTSHRLTDFVGKNMLSCDFSLSADHTSVVDLSQYWLQRNVWLYGEVHLWLQESEENETKSLFFPDIFTYMFIFISASQFLFLLLFLANRWPTEYRETFRARLFLCWNSRVCVYTGNARGGECLSPN